ncbi:Metaxin-1-like protein [Leptotrombidium deliense]|uniref:Metaxin-1-like protein n=1 Tax=Leptotrombidium deliense TaxID=299467 RepID=A0A443SDA2_9ACAR|nr:Metaxin-1-like protein [Leptotrombidium deliense]
MEVDLWSGDFGLPSVDSNCLQILALTTFSKVPVKVNFSNNPWKWFSSTLPVFRSSSKGTMTKFSEVWSFFKSEVQNYDIESHLSKKDLSDINAYIAMVTHKLEPCLMYLWWGDEKNYIEFTRPWFAKKIPFPGNYFIPGHLQRKVDEMLKATFENIDESQIPAILFSDAQKCMTLLSEKLSHNEYFIGKKPTAFDAVAFSYLAPILMVPFPNSKQLQNHLKACTNLTKFVERIIERYFPVANKSDKSKFENASQTPSDDVDFPHKWRDIILSTLFASAAMIGYSLVVGIIRVSFNDKIEDEENDSDEEET